jgi:hypothetical protein
MSQIPIAGAKADTLLVYTSKSADQIIESGGSGRWALDPTRVHLLKWLVCVQNHRDDRPEFDGDAPVNSAFLLGTISGVQNVTQADDTSKRWFVALDEVARINYPDMWDGKRAPIRYTRLSELGIDPERENFEKIDRGRLDASAPNGAHRSHSTSSSASFAQIIATAKAKLAAELGIDAGAIEVLIHS